MGSIWRYHRKLKPFSRLVSLSGRTFIFLSCLLLCCACILSQYDSRTRHFSQPYAGLVNAFHPSRDQVTLEGVTENQVDPRSLKAPRIPLSHTPLTGRNQGLRQGTFSGTGKAGTTEPVRGSRRSIQVVPTERTPKLQSRSIDVQHEEHASKTISVRSGNKKTLAEYLHFTEKTALNYMHFHKTGGVSYKRALFAFFVGKTKRNGEKVRLWEACYEKKINGASHWRCDWDPIRAMNETERNKLDVIFGHQYWQRGAYDFLNKRDMRTFSVIRHPFDRKVSFFFHFRVRERNRDENKVSFEEIRDFLLYGKTGDGTFSWGCDRGPNYMAGRLLSDGCHGYVRNKYHQYYGVKPGQEKEIVERSLRIMRSYIFIGLQSESPASKCMLRKTVKEFKAAHGIDIAGTDEVARTLPVVNTGSYKMSAQKIWDQMSVEDRRYFNKKEQIDLAIYKESVRLFKQQVRLFGCDHLVKKRYLLES